MRRSAGIVVAMGAMLGILAGCSGGDADAAAKTVAGQMPDLSSQGLTSFSCGTGNAIGGSFQAPAEPFVAQCWKGSPSGSFLDVANATQDAVLAATGGVNVTSDVCPEDALSAAGGIACRAVLVTDADSSVVVRTVAVLADPATVLKDLPANPTQDQIHAAIEGAAIEVLVGTQSPTEDSATSPTASS